MSAIEQLHRDAAGAETDIATAAREEFLASYTLLPSDVLDGGAALKERVRFAQQAAEQKASDEDGARRAAIIEVNHVGAVYLDSQNEIRALIPDWAQALSNLRALRQEYERCQAVAIALKCDDVPRRINSLAVEAALNDRELQKTITGLALLLQSDL